MEAISIVTKQSPNYAPQHLQNAFSSRLREVAETSTVVQGNSLVSNHTEPKMIWQEIYNYLDHDNAGIVKRYKDAFQVIRANHLDAAQILRSADFALCETLLSKAIETKEFATVKLVLTSLTSEEVDTLINLQGEAWRLNSPLSIACGLRSPDAEAIFALLLEYGADPKQSSCSFMNEHLPIHAATYAGNLAIVRRLLDNYPEQIDAGSNYWGDKNCGGSPLALAILTERTEMVEYLLKKGASLRPQRIDGESLLDFAEQSGNTELARLVKSHASPTNNLK